MAIVSNDTIRLDGRLVFGGRNSTQLLSAATNTSSPAELLDDELGVLEIVNGTMKVCGPPRLVDANPWFTVCVICLPFPYAGTR